MHDKILITTYNFGGDFGCRRFKRQEDEDTWHWDHSFYGADIESLRHIAALVGAETDG